MNATSHHGQRTARTDAHDHQDDLTPGSISADHRVGTCLCQRTEQGQPPNDEQNNCSLRQLRRLDPRVVTGQGLEELNQIGSVLRR